MGAESAAPDRSAQAIRAFLAPRTLLVGAVAGLAIVALTSGILLLLGLVPNDTWRTALGAVGFDDSTRARIGGGFLGAWSGKIEYAYGQDASGPSSFRATLPQAMLFGLLAIGLVGLLARRWIPRGPFSRLGALAAAALVAAAVVSALASVFESTSTDEGFSITTSYDAASYLFATAAAVLIVGVFSLGVVGALSARFSIPTKAAAIAFAVVLGAVTLATPFLFAVPEAKGKSFFESPFPLELVGATAWAPATGTSVVALSVGAPAHLGTNSEFNPYEYFVVDQEQPTWNGLAEFTNAHDHARIDGYAGAGGTLWKLGVFGVAALVLAVWLVAGLVSARKLGSRRPLDGLVHGGLVGLAGGILLFATSWLVALSGHSTSFEDDTKDVYGYWGTSGTDVLWATLGLVIVTGIAGAVYAAFRPAPAGDSSLPSRGADPRPVM